MPLDPATPAMQQSLAGRLPPELLMSILSFFEGSRPTFEQGFGYRRKMRYFAAVCHSWRVARQLQAQCLSFQGTKLTSRLKVFLEELRSCTGDEAHKGAISKVYYGDYSQHPESPELLVELLQKAAISLSYLNIHSTFRSKAEMNSPLYASKLFEVVCTMRKLAHLSITGTSVTMAHLRRYVQSEPQPMNICSYTPSILPRRIVFHSANLRSLHLGGAEVDYSDPTNFSTLLSTSPILLPPRELHHLSFTITDNPSSIHLLAFLLSTNTVTHLTLHDASEPKSHAYLVDSLLPLLMQHASKLRKFRFEADMDSDYDDMDSDNEGPTAKQYCFELDKVLPLLTNCRDLMLPASSIPFPITEDACFLIDPSSLPVLSSLYVTDNEDHPDEAIIFWEPLIRARAGGTLINIDFTFTGYEEVGEHWRLLHNFCSDKGVDLNDIRMND